MSDHHPEPFAGHVPLRPISVSDLVAAHPDMRPIVIDGILRKGETANIIAAPKVGKSYLAGNLAWAVATGTSFMLYRQSKLVEPFVGGIKFRNCDDENFHATDRGMTNSRTNEN